MKSVMRRVVAGGMCVVMIGSTGTSWAQGDEASEDAPRTQFIELGELELDGDRGKARMMRTRTDRRASFGRLSRLKKSALPKLREMAEGL